LVTHLAISAVSSGVQIPLVLALAASIAVRSWYAYRIALLKEKGRTDRLKAAIERVSATHRAEVIRACDRLENGDSTRKSRDGKDLVLDDQADNHY
jgi:hypothetical protein